MELPDDDDFWNNLPPGEIERVFADGQARVRSINESIAVSSLTSFLVSGFLSADSGAFLAAGGTDRCNGLNIRITGPYSQRSAIGSHEARPQCSRRVRKTHS